MRTCVLANWNRKLIRDVNGRHLENLNDVKLHCQWFDLQKNRNQEQYWNITSGFYFCVNMASLCFYKTVNNLYVI